MKLRQHICRLSILVCLLGTLTSAIGASSADKKSEEMVAQGKDFQSKGKLTEAIWAYRQAAKAGNLAGTLAAGELLFARGKAAAGRERVLALSEGLGYLYVAATNRQPQACVALADALQSGLGVRTNLVSAYAWLKVAAENDPSFKPDLDRLVVQLEPFEVLQAQQSARQYLSGHWPAQVARAVDQGDPRLQIQGVSQGARGTLVIVNGETLAAGESVNILPAGNASHDPKARLTVSCREIGSNYLLLAVAGEPDLKMLSLETP